MKDRELVSAIVRSALDKATKPLEKCHNRFDGMFGFAVMVEAQCGDGLVSQAFMGISADVFEIATVDAMRELISNARCQCDRCNAARERFGKCLEILVGYEAGEGETVQ